jgi:SAM-dependent methyltransferase
LAIEKKFIEKFSSNIGKTGLSIMSKWPKELPILTEKQQYISDDFMAYWHEILPKRYRLIELFNHNYPVKNSNTSFLKTLEIGAGLGEHLEYEKLLSSQLKNYTALELRPNLAKQIKASYPEIEIIVGDCQINIPKPQHYYDRVLAIHVLEHLPNLPAAIKEIHRVCNPNGQFLVVIPCEGGIVYSLARKVSAKRIFEKRYNQSYDWFISREHINKPNEIIEELLKYFSITHRAYFPFLIPSINLNLCIGLTLKPL